MCKDCGCGSSGKVVEIEHEHDDLGKHKHFATTDAAAAAHLHAAHEHGHRHEHEHHHEHGEGLRKIQLATKVLADNDRAAEENAAFFQARKITAVNMISSPGSGKTFLLERTLERLSSKMRLAVIVGDQQTDNDARRLANKGAPIRQLETGNTCHLDARRVAEVLPEVLESKTRLLFIENIGNLICPAAFSLGERLKIVLLAVTEGEDKPLKYASTFSGADLVLITKSDLIPYIDYDRARCLEAIKRVAPESRVIEVSAKSGAGMSEWFEFLEGCVSNDNCSEP